MVKYHDILKAYRGEHADDIHAMLWGRALAQRSTEISGSLSLIFQGYGKSLEDYRIYGNSSGAGDYSEELEGYQIPIKIMSGNAAAITYIYIGSAPLYLNEYISFSEQKIYRYINGILTPTVPAVSLPSLLPFSGTNILSAETEIQPSAIYLKGKIKSLATHMLIDSENRILISSDNYQLVTKEQ